MKKQSILKLTFVTLGIMVGLSSCKKCQTCTYGSYREEFCEDDFENKSAYKAYISYLEANGAKCK